MTLSAGSRRARHWTVYVCPTCERIFKQARDALEASGLCYHQGQPVQPEEVEVVEVGVRKRSEHSA